MCRQNLSRKSLILKQVENRIFNLRALACMDAGGRAASGTRGRDKSWMDLFRASLNLLVIDHGNMTARKMRGRHARRAQLCLSPAFKPGQGRERAGARLDVDLVQRLLARAFGLGMQRRKRRRQQQFILQQLHDGKLIAS